MPLIKPKNQDAGLDDGEYYVFVESTHLNTGKVNRRWVPENPENWNKPKFVEIIRRNDKPFPRIDYDE